MQKKSIIAALSVLAAVAVGYFIGNRQNETVLTTPVVHTYKVSPDRADEIKAQLNSLMDAKEGDRTGRVQAFSNGLLVVRAPIGFQRGIQKLIEQIGAAGPSSRTSIRVDYWVVAGLEGKESNASSMQPLAAALESIEKVDGPRHFRVLEHLATNSASGQEVAIKGSISSALTTAMAGGDIIRLRVELKSKMGEVRADTQMKTDEFLVIGQNAYLPDAPPQTQPLGLTKIVTGPANIYYILRAR